MEIIYVFNEKNARYHVVISPFRLLNDDYQKHLSPPI